MILFYSFLSNVSTLLLFLISDKSGNEMLVSQMGIYRNEKELKICVKKYSNKLAGWFQFQLLLDNEVCFKNVHNFFHGAWCLWWRLEIRGCGWERGLRTLHCTLNPQEKFGHQCGLVPHYIYIYIYIYNWKLLKLS